MIKRLTDRDWNSIPNKPNEVNVSLKPWDIVYKINDLWCACETTNECNNILIYSDKYDIKNIKSMLAFIYILGKYEEIKYITVASVPSRYDIFKKMFKKWGAFPPPKDGRDKFFFKLDSEGLDFLRKKIKGLF